METSAIAMLLLAVLTAGSIAANIIELRHVLKMEKRFLEERKSRKN